MLIGGAAALVFICGGLFLAATAGAKPAEKCIQFHQATANATINLVNSELKGDALWIVAEAGADRMRLTAVCKFGADGEVDSLGTDIAWLSSLMDGVTSCLSRSSANWDAHQMRYTQPQEDCGEAAVSKRSRWLRHFRDGDLERAFGKK